MGLFSKFRRRMLHTITRTGRKQRTRTIWYETACSRATTGTKTPGANTSDGETSREAEACSNYSPAYIPWPDNCFSKPRYLRQGRGTLRVKPPRHSVARGIRRSRSCPHLTQKDAVTYLENKIRQPTIQSEVLDIQGAPGSSRSSRSSSGDVQVHIKDIDHGGLEREVTRVLNQRFVLHECDIILAKQLGHGHFGSVFQGMLKDPRTNSFTEVAVKTLKPQSYSKKEKQKVLDNFLREALMMKKFKHENVLTLTGVCITSNLSMKIVMPLMKYGDLKRLLIRRKGTLNIHNLLTFAYQIASGMNYLSNHKYVHRDLAARNCLIDEDNTVKVADFGLSRKISEKDYYKMTSQTALPFKWMAPETLSLGRFSTKSDVWSYGIVLWEVMTRGEEPYKDFEDTSRLQQFLDGGQRLEKPKSCPDIVYSAMLECWEIKPGDRPSFQILLNCIEEADLNQTLPLVNCEDPLFSEPEDICCSLSFDSETTLSVEEKENTLNESQQSCPSCSSENKKRDIFYADLIMPPSPSFCSEKYQSFSTFIFPETPEPTYKPKINNTPTNYSNFISSTKFCADSSITSTQYNCTFENAKNPECKSKSQGKVWEIYKEFKSDESVNSICGSKDLKLFQIKRNSISFPVENKMYTLGTLCFEKGCERKSKIIPAAESVYLRWMLEKKPSGKKYRRCPITCNMNIAFELKV